MVNEVVLPGDKLTATISPSSDPDKLVLGPGLRRHASDIYATRCGVLKDRKPNVFWVDGHQKRYIPARGDTVLGIVTNRGAETLKVDIGASESAILSLFAFEGSTKRNKPNVQPGDLVYARVLVSDKDVEPELVCVNSYGKANGLGVLPGKGYLVTVPIDVCRKILAPKCPLLSTLGKKIHYELAVGMNSRIWVLSSSIKNTITVINSLILVENMNDDEIKDMCSEFLDS